jgi:tRNA threonylcarbamoyladenosine biosynthesis protein TsaB
VTLTLAFDTATEIATSALLEDGRVLGERSGEPRALLEDVDALLAAAGAAPRDLDALVVGTGPGSFTSTRIGLATARGLALALDLPVAGVSTLDALAAAAEDAFPVIDARRGEVFVPGLVRKIGIRARGFRSRETSRSVRFADGPLALAPDDLALEPGALCVGSGAVRYRAALEGKGAVVPPDDDPLHVPHACLHASLARDFGPADAIAPVYVRAPDAKERTTA